MEGSMGLFDRNDYGRDYRGEGRGLGDRLRGAWHRFEDRLEGGAGRGYDRGMRGYDRGMRGGGGYDASDFAYRGLEGGWSTARNRGAHDAQWDWRRAGGSPYDQDMMSGYGRDYGARGYDPGMRGGGMLGRTQFGGARRAWRQGGPDRYDAGYRGGWGRGR
jgi:hypothetical protein